MNCSTECMVTPQSIVEGARRYVSGERPHRK